MNKNVVILPEALLVWKGKLIKLIDDLGLTQEQFAAQIGVKRRAVCRWVSFKDASIPHRRHLDKIKVLMNANDPAKLTQVKQPEMVILDHQIGA